MSGFREKALRTNERTDGRTDGRTDATPKVSTTSWSRDQKTYPKSIWLVKKRKRNLSRKTCFSKVLSINESALWRHNLKKKNLYKMAMDEPIRIILVPLNLILQRL